MAKPVAPAGALVVADRRATRPITMASSATARQVATVARTPVSNKTLIFMSSPTRAPNILLGWTLSSVITLPSGFNAGNAFGADSLTGGMGSSSLA